jgi:hypothetical protein
LLGSMCTLYGLQTCNEGASSRLLRIAGSIKRRISFFTSYLFKKINYFLFFLLKRLELMFLHALNKFWH